ncbi:M56 family metallopeptidase [Nubsella zeaxanthinifaciens]|uniref:M56 family metallopeptidase n=1 Tax=Nubsella zeaxanthinifaciens TaxID=392412 RepID=UPI003CFC2778
MPQLFIILLKINLVLLLFAATYHLVLRRLTFYILNRCFLVLGILFSTVYPFIDLTDFFHQQQMDSGVVAYLPQLNQQAADLMPKGFFNNNWPILSAVFYLGVLLMTLRLAVQFLSLYKIHRKSSPGKVANYQVRLLKDSVSPFSFWQTVYVNPNLHSDNELDAILAHEMVHVKQWHTLDIILAELSVVFYWFNPGVWLMKKAVKENLEFITDQRILKKGMDKKAYQYSLLGVGQLNASVAIVNNFNLSDLKKRIQMMNLKRSSKINLGRYALIVPVLAVTLAFTVSKKDIKTHIPMLSKIVGIDTIPTITKSNPKKAEATLVKSGVKKITHRKTNNNDTVSFANVVVNTISINRDSLKKGMPNLDELVAQLRVKFNIPEDAKIIRHSLEKNFIFVRADSSGKANQAVINDISVGFRKARTNEMPPPDGEKRIVIRAVKISDTANISKQQVEYLVNGKVADVADFKKINPNEIVQVNVMKNNSNKPQIFIETKKN